MAGQGHTQGCPDLLSCSNFTHFASRVCSEKWLNRWGFPLPLYWLYLSGVFIAFMTCSKWLCFLEIQRNARSLLEQGQSPQLPIWGGSLSGVWDPSVQKLGNTGEQFIPQFSADHFMTKGEMIHWALMEPKQLLWTQQSAARTNRSDKSHSKHLYWSVFQSFWIVILKGLTADLASLQTLQNKGKGTATLGWFSSTLGWYIVMEIFCHMPCGAF